MKITSTCRGATLDATLAVLADQRRRLVIRYLRESSNGVASCEELADYVSTPSSTRRDREKTLIHLHHVSLPKLDRAELIEYNSRSNTVRYQPRSKAEALIECIDRVDRE